MDLSYQNKPSTLGMIFKQYGVLGSNSAFWRSRRQGFIFWLKRVARWKIRSALEPSIGGHWMATNRAETFFFAMASSLLDCPVTDATAAENVITC